MFRILTVILFSLALFSCSKTPVYDEAPFDGNNVIIETSGLTEKVPVFFTFKTDKKQINFFVLKIDGDVQSYFDACARCYPKKLGYRPDKDMVVCRACDIRYYINDLKDGIGSCYPIRFEGRTAEKVYLIHRDSVLKGEKYF